MSAVELRKLLIDKIQKADNENLFQELTLRMKPLRYKLKSLIKQSNREIACWTKLRKKK
jgi:hypothetical protein